MPSDDCFLSALSFSDAAPRRPSRSPSAGRHRGSPSPIRGNPSALFSFTPTAATSPSLYTAVSALGAYPSDYPYGSYNSINPAAAAAVVPPAAGSHPHTYAWWVGDVSGETPTASPAEVRAAEAQAHTAVSEAERQRLILEMERGLAEEQRERLLARFSSRSVASSSAAAAVAPARASPSPSPSRRTPAPQEASPATSESAARASPSLPPYAAHDTAEDRLRAFSMEALPPPSSPSPPSAHAHGRHEGGAVDVANGSAERAEKRRGAQLNSTAVVYAMPDDDVRLRPSPSPSPPAAAREAAPQAEVAALPPRVLRQRRASPSASPARSASRPRTPPFTTPDVGSAAGHEDGALHAPNRQASPLPPPSIGAGRSEADSRAAHQQQQRGMSRAVAQRSAAASGDDTEVDEEDERLYDAYRRKLARIQDALRPRHTAAQLTSPASEAAYVAYQRRCRLLTPALDASSPSPHVLPSPSVTHGQRYADVPDLVRQRPLPPPPPPQSLRLRARGGAGRPLTLRAPSGDACEDASAAITAAHPLPQRPRRRLRWDLARSGNITLSSDGAVCRADATDALGLIEREYDGRLEEVLSRLVIPFYAAGSIGLTRGSLTFALRWTSPSASAASAPALAFGVATRDFAGYGAAAPAFLYLSSGVIAQGVPGGGGVAGGRGVERAYGAPYTPGLELAARLDLDRGELEFYVEGVSMGVAFHFQPARHPAPLFPVVVFAAELDAAELLYATLE